MTDSLTFMRYHTEGGAGVITLNNPSSLNALNSTMIRELGALLESLSGEGNIGALVIRGEGKAFVAGADIRQMQAMTPEEAREYSMLGNRVFDAVERFPLPVIAEVNGFALGGGLELMMSCDIAYASRSAKFGLPELTLGLIPGFGGCRRLMKRIGISRAKELIYTGRMADAAEAYAIGLVDRLCDPDALASDVSALVRQIRTVSPNALMAAKPLFLASAELDHAELSQFESRQFENVFRHHDARTGMSAFLSKTTPVWGDTRSERPH